MPESVGRAGVTGVPVAVTAMPARSLRMTASSLGLIAGKVASMGLGFLFWLAAARLASAAEVGLAAGAVSAMMLCVQLGLLGVGAAFVATYPGHPDRPALLDTAISLALVVGLAAAAVFVGVAAVGLSELDVLTSSPAYALWFLLAASAGTVGVVLDQISMALGRGDQVLARNVVNGVVTLALLGVLAAVVGGPTSIQLFSMWALGAVAAFALSIRQLRGTAEGYRFRPRLPRPIARALVTDGLGHYALTCSERMPALVLPIIITETLSPELNAYWYGVWMMAWAAYVVPVSIGIGLFAEGSHRPASLGPATAKATRSALAIGGAVAAVLGVGAPLALGALGPAYADAGVTPLRILVLGVAPLALVHAYYAAARVRRRLVEAVAAAAVTGLLGIAAVTVAGRASGLAAMAWAWVAVQVLAAAWSALRLRSIIAMAPTEQPLPAVAPA